MIKKKIDPNDLVMPSRISLSWLENDHFFEVSITGRGLQYLEFKVSLTQFPNYVEQIKSVRQVPEAFAQIFGILIHESDIQRAHRAWQQSSGRFGVVKIER